MSIYQYEFLHAHGYITDNRYDQIRANCILGYGGEGCEEVRKLADKAFAGTKTQINNIYAPCFNQAIPNLPRKYLQSSLKRTML